MGRFDISPEVAEEYRAKFRDAVQPHLDEDVLAVGTFRTTGSGQKFAISKLQAGALVYGAASKLGRARAGGLPGTFLLAVTPTRLHAFKYKMKRNGVEVKEDVAAWDRTGLTVLLEQARDHDAREAGVAGGRHDRLRRGRHGRQPLGGRRRPRASDGPGHGRVAVVVERERPAGPMGLAPRCRAQERHVSVVVEVVTVRGRAVALEPQ